jgi:glycosyltransferase involved in cell wall biosynthesis
MEPASSLITVIIPCFNGEKFLSEAVRSVIAQNYSQLQILIVDDGSTDKSVEISKSFPEPVRSIQKIHGGLSHTLNHGLREARRGFIGFIDVDDRWPEGRLKWQMKIFDESPEIEIVAGTLRRFLYDSATGKEKELPENQRAMSIGASLFRSSVFEKVGIFDETIRCSDLDWFMRAKELNVKMHFDDRLALYYRRHDQNMTNDEQENQVVMMQMLKRSLDRKRGKS